MGLRLREAEEDWLTIRGRAVSVGGLLGPAGAEKVREAREEAVAQSVGRAVALGLAEAVAAGTVGLALLHTDTVPEAVGEPASEPDAPADGLGVFEPASEPDAPADTLGGAEAIAVTDGALDTLTESEGLPEKEEEALLRALREGERVVEGHCVPPCVAVREAVTVSVAVMEADVEALPVRRGDGVPVGVGVGGLVSLARREGVGIGVRDQLIMEMGEEEAEGVMPGVAVVEGVPSGAVAEAQGVGVAVESSSAPLGEALALPVPRTLPLLCPLPDALREVRREAVLMGVALAVGEAALLAQGVGEVAEEAVGALEALAVPLAAAEALPMGDTVALAVAAAEALALGEPLGPAGVGEGDCVPCPEVGEAVEVREKVGVGVGVEEGVPDSAEVGEGGAVAEMEAVAGAVEEAHAVAHAEGVGEGKREGVLEENPVAVDENVGALVTVVLVEARAEAEAVLQAVGEGVGVTPAAVGEGVAVLPSAGEEEGEVLPSCEADAVAEAACVGDVRVDTVAEAEKRAEEDPSRQSPPPPTPPLLREAVMETLGVRVTLAMVSVGVGVRERVDVALGELETLRVELALPEWVAVAHAVPVGVPAPTLAVGDAVSLREPVCVVQPVAVAVSVALPVGEKVSMLLTLELADTDAVAQAVLVSVP